MTAALVVIDVQESFRQRPIWQAVSEPDIVARVNQLVAAARGRGDLVVWVLHSEPGSDTVFDPASGHVRLMDGLAPDAGEPTLTKNTINAFTSTDLERVLRDADVSELTVCGIQTEQCCETTARLAADLGFDVTFAIDATATFPIEHWDAPDGRSVAEVLADPLTLSTEDIIRGTRYALEGRFATVRTVEALTGS